jgi:hypothetical protein
VILLISYIVSVCEDPWSAAESLSLMWVKKINFSFLIIYLSFPSSPNLEFDLSDYECEEFDQVNSHTQEYYAY